jgi:hypothetical protein
VIQFFLAAFGLTSIYFAMGHNVTLRRWAPVIGLAGQPFWAVFAWQSEGWGLAILVAAYTLVYIQGIRMQWGRKA